VWLVNVDKNTAVDRRVEAVSDVIPPLMELLSMDSV
jgi:hypothetical protein